jgi:CrcB protein
VTATALVGVTVAGAVGAPARYLLDRAVQRRVGRTLFPWGTFAVNITGSLLLGLVTGAALYHGFHGAPRAWLATGFCGAYTTFSTLTFETLGLAEAGDRTPAVANVVASLLAGTAAAAAGLAIAAAF